MPIVTPYIALIGLALIPFFLAGAAIILIALGIYAHVRDIYKLFADSGERRAKRISNAQINQILKSLDS